MKNLAPIDENKDLTNKEFLGNNYVRGRAVTRAQYNALVESGTVDMEVAYFITDDNVIVPPISANTPTTLNGLLFGSGGTVGTKALDTESLTDDNDHVPTSGLVKGELDDLKSALNSFPKCINGTLGNGSTFTKNISNTRVAFIIVTRGAASVLSIYILDQWGALQELSTSASIAITVSEDTLSIKNTAGMVVDIAIMDFER